MNECLNCGAALSGAFCSACGQRSVPPNPTVAELAGDAWHELSGYDGRVASTVRGLLEPGRLTTEYLGGRRARYLSPIRLYLIVSVLYFLVSAAAPAGIAGPGAVSGPGGLRIAIVGTADGPEPTDQERAELRAKRDEAPAILRPLIRALDEDPQGFRARVFTIMPRVFFAMLPVFAAILALFYRRRHFPTALVFAAHLHAFAFLIFTIPEASKITGMPVLTSVVGAIAAIVFTVYTLAALRAVYGGRWAMTVAKAAGIGVVYLIAALPAFFVILLWASFGVA